MEVVEGRWGQGLVDKGQQKNFTKDTNLPQLPAPREEKDTNLPQLPDPSS